jgi:hypothetical protein
LASLFGINRNRLVGFKVAIALDREAEFAADGREFCKADISKLGTTKPKIAEAEG